MIVNRSGAVFGDDGKRLYGMDAELHLKMKAKEDPEWEKQCAKWVAEVTGEKVDPDHLYESLNDGQILIKLVNTIKPGTITNWNKIDASSSKLAATSVALAATGNIRLYLAAVQQLGVPGVDMFLVDDLRTGRAMTMVCRNLASLARHAARDHGWTGPVIGPRLATPGPKSWADVEYKPYQEVEEIPQSELEEMLLMYKGMLEKERQDLIQALSREGHLKHELEKLNKAIENYQLEHHKFLDYVAQDPNVSQSRAFKEFSTAVHQFGDPNMPEHLQPVQKTSTVLLEHKAATRTKKLTEAETDKRKSQGNINEWQEKVQKVQKKMEAKRERRLSFGTQIESPMASSDQNAEEDIAVDLTDESSLLPGSRKRAGTPSKAYRGQIERQGGVSRRTLIVIMVRRRRRRRVVAVSIFPFLSEQLSLSFF